MKHRHLLVVAVAAVFALAAAIFAAPIAMAAENNTCGSNTCSIQIAPGVGGDLTVTAINAQTAGRATIAATTMATPTAPVGNWDDYALTPANIEAAAHGRAAVLEAKNYIRMSGWQLARGSYSVILPNYAGGGGNNALIAQRGFVIVRA